MLEITFNNHSICLTASISLQELLVTNGYKDHYFAVAVNRVFIPKSQYQQTSLQSGDVIDVITPMQGG